MRQRVLAMVLVVALFGCVSPRRTPSSNGGGGGGGTGGELYVATPSAILRFGSALSDNGAVGPSAVISGSATQLSSPQHILIDTATDRLFVPNQGGHSILIFQTASAKTGNVSPDAVITSTSLAAPVDVAIDPANNLLYVADGSSILVFSGESTFAGTSTLVPVRNITTGFTIGAILLDTANNRMFVADPVDNAVDIMDSASAQNNLAIFTGSVAGAQTGLDQPNGIALDASGRLIVSNSAGGSITIYPAAVIPGGGNAAPAATISGTSTRLAHPGQIFLNRGAVNGGELYVADTTAAAILIFANMSTAGGNTAPARSISGAGTDLTANAVNGLSLDATR